VADGVRTHGGANERVAIAHVAIDWLGELVARRVRDGCSCEDDALVPSLEERPDERAAEVARAAGNEDLHRGVCGLRPERLRAGGRSFE
jgi:hypothetical protein